MTDKEFFFDATNKLTKTANSAKGTASYTYNGFGSRVGVKSSTESIRYVLDLTRDYNNLLGRSVNGKSEDFIYDSGLLSMSSQDDSYFYLLDELGSPVYMTGEDATVCGAYAYDEFGGRKSFGESLGNVNQPFTFTGYQEDEYSGSYFAQARYYMPGAGRFASRDQDRFIDFEEAKSNNLYDYCWSNPLIYWDPLGHYTKAQGKEAHDYIEEYAMLVLAPDCIREFPVEGGSFHGKGRYGRADIVVFNNNIAEIYEIKPGSYAMGTPNHTSAMAQLNGYVRAFNDPRYSNLEDTGMDFAISGKSYDSYFNNLAMPSSLCPGEYIVCRTYGDSLVIYNYQKRVPDGYRVYVPSEVREKERNKESAMAVTPTPEVTYSWYNKIPWDKMAVGTATLAGAAGLAMLADDVSLIGIADDLGALSLLGLAFILGGADGSANTGEKKGSCVN